MGIQVIRRSSHIAVPWKNGGGVTHEVIRVPAGSGPFRWRVSVAQIDMSGPFSDFAGYDRKMLLLRGAGVALQFGDGTAEELREVGDWVEFDGAVATQCRLLDGPCVDLNLIVSKAVPAAARVALLDPSLSLQASHHQTVLIFAIGQPIELRAGDASAETLQLGTWDLGVLTDCAATLRRMGADPARTPVFLATLNDPP